MAWTIKFAPQVENDLKRLDRAAKTRILETLETRIAALDDPRSLAAPLKGEHGGYWRWRIGDYRVIGTVEDAVVTILIVRIGHRREVYR